MFVLRFTIPPKNDDVIYEQALSQGKHYDDGGNDEDDDDDDDDDDGDDDECGGGGNMKVSPQLSGCKEGWSGCPGNYKTNFHFHINVKNHKKSVPYR